MRRGALFVVVLVVACASPSRDIDGVWSSGGLSTDHFSYYHMVLRTNGDEISGRACRTGQGKLLYGGFTVTGDYPHLEFKGRGPSAGDLGEIFVGKYDDGIIDGTWRNGLTGRTEQMQFKRAMSPLPEGCE